MSLLCVLETLVEFFSFCVNILVQTTLTFLGYFANKEKSSVQKNPRNADAHESRSPSWYGLTNKIQGMRGIEVRKDVFVGPPRL